MDTRTLAFTIVLIGTMLALLLSSIAFSRRERALSIYAAGYVGAAVCFWLFTGQASLPRILGIVASNVLLAFYQFCVAWGLRTSLGLVPAWPRRFAYYLAASVLAAAYWTFGYDSFLFRVLQSSAFSVITCIELLLALRRSSHLLGLRVRGFAMTLICAWMAAHAARTVLVFYMENDRSRLLENHLPNILIFAATVCFTVLWAGVVLMVDSARLLKQLEEKNRILKELAATDELTGLHNRHQLETDVQGEMDRAARYRDPLSLIIFDLDHFKRVNDTWGHAAGDEVLKRVSAVCRDLVRKPDTLYRWGGEEFLVLVPHTPLAGAVSLAEKLRRAVSADDFRTAVPVTASFGVAEWRGGESREAWFAEADQALYRAKHEGRNRVAAGADFAAPPAPPALALRLEWRSEWASGNDIVDRGHQRLLELSNELLSLSLQRSRPEETYRALDTLIGFVAAHFRDEERVLAELGYPDLERHSRKHRELEAAAAGLRDGAGTGAVFEFLVDRVVLEHLTRCDVDFFPYTRNSGDAT